MKRGTQCGVKFVELIDNASKHAFLPITLQVSTELVKCGLLDHTPMSPLTTSRLHCMTAALAVVVGNDNKNIHPSIIN